MKNQTYNIVAELYLSKGKTLYGKINRLNPVSSNISLSDSISISDVQQESKTSTSKKVNVQQENITSLQNLTFSDETINKIKLAMKEAFSDALKESTKNLSMLIEVIKELADIIDKKGQTVYETKNTSTDVPVFNKKENLSSDLPDDELPNDDLLDDDDLPDD